MMIDLLRERGTRAIILILTLKKVFCISAIGVILIKTYLFCSVSYM